MQPQPMRPGGVGPIERWIEWGGLLRMDTAVPHPCAEASEGGAIATPVRVGQSADNAWHMILYDDALSSASFRVRIALALKEIGFGALMNSLHPGENLWDWQTAVNRQRVVPALEMEAGMILEQSMALLGYLDELQPDPPLVPGDAVGRARVRALSQVITRDLHPFNNLHVLNYLEQKIGLDKPVRDAWYRNLTETGFEALEAFLAQESRRGNFCHGDVVTLADLCLVPQVFNARRLGVDLRPYPSIVAIDAACRMLPAFRDAAPETR